MVWGCMAASGVGNLHFIDGIMNAKCYEEIFSTQMLPSVSELLGHHYVFQHDHTARWIVAFLK